MGALAEDRLALAPVGVQSVESLFHVKENRMGTRPQSIHKHHQKSFFNFNRFDLRYTDTHVRFDVKRYMNTCRISKRNAGISRCSNKFPFMDFSTIERFRLSGLNGGSKRVYVCVTVLVGELEPRKISLMLTWLWERAQEEEVAAVPFRSTVPFRLILSFFLPLTQIRGLGHTASVSPSIEDKAAKSLAR